MSTDRTELFAALAALAAAQPAAGDAPIAVAAIVGAWLGRGPAVLEGDDRETLNELCRQIDVRKKVSVGYGPGWKRLDPEEPAEPAVVSGLIAVLLANAAGVGEPGPHGACNDGWGLKCTNSALKALELREQLPFASELRVWSIDVLDRIVVA